VKEEEEEPMGSDDVPSEELQDDMLDYLGLFT
jgi:hypothetical protein